MLVPVLVGLRGEGVVERPGPRRAPRARGAPAAAASDALLPALAAVGLHSVAMLAVAGVLAVVVYQKVGVEVLRRAWINLDLIWVGALAITGGIALGLGLWPVLVG